VFNNQSLHLHLQQLQDSVFIPFICGCLVVTPGSKKGKSGSWFYSVLVGFQVEQVEIADLIGEGQVLQCFFEELGLFLVIFRHF